MIIPCDRVTIPTNIVEPFCQTLILSALLDNNNITFHGATQPAAVQHGLI